MKLNLGCGRNPVDGWTNVDQIKLPGVDIQCILGQQPLPLEADTVDEFQGIDLIEHIASPLVLMHDLWRVAKPGATCRFELPYGSSDDAWEDPTHVRPYFVNSWIYFGQPTYYRADYGYRGDWRPTLLELHVRPGVQMEDVMFTRNTVVRQVIHLEAVKPLRTPGVDPVDVPDIKLFEVR